MKKIFMLLVALISLPSAHLFTAAAPQLTWPQPRHNTPKLQSIIQACKNGTLIPAETLSSINNQDLEDMNALHHALKNGHHELSMQLLSHYIENNLNITKQAPELEGDTPVHLAANKGFVDCLALLIAILTSRQDSIDVLCQFGNTPLISAMAGNQLTAVNMLIEARADVNKICQDGLRPIFYAVKFYKPRMLNLLRQAKADITLKTTNQITIDEYIIDSGLQQGMSPESEPVKLLLDIVHDRPNYSRKTNNANPANLAAAHNS